MIVERSLAVPGDGSAHDEESDSHTNLPSLKSTSEIAVINFGRRRSVPRLADDMWNGRQSSVRYRM